MAKAQILVVEDDNIVVLELRDRLQSLGYAVSGVASYGGEAIEKAAETRPDLVLMDIRLKGAVDGVEAAEEIRARFDIPVVYLTAYADENTLQRAKVTEPYGYIIKPFEERELHSAIEVALYKHKAEEALRESEKRFRELVENANDVIYTHDLEGNFTSVNPAATRIYGYTTEEILRLNIAQIVDPEYLPLARQKIQEKLEGSPRIEPYELLTYSKEGEPIWVEVSTRLPEKEGQPVGVQGIARDITERKRAVEKLRESEEKYRLLTETAREMIISHDMEGHVTYANKAALETSGYSEEEALRMNINVVVPADQLAGLKERYTKRTSGNAGAYTYETEFITRTGRRIPVEMSSSLLIKHGKPSGVLIVGRDITERKRAEEMLRESEARFRTLFENVPNVAVQGYGSDGTIHYWNKANEIIYGYAAEEAIGKNLIDLIIPPEMRNEVREMIKHGAQTGEMLPASELSLLRKDGTRVSVFSSHAVVKQPGREPELFCIDVDLTELKRAEEELQHTLEKLRKTLGATIQAMAFTVETRDSYTAGHQRQVANLAHAIATEMGLSKEQIEGLCMAAVIHDLGKITVPTDILNKPGQLTGNEFGIIKCHPRTGYDILKTIEFPWPIAQIIFQHHERMDGSGYPQGLSGEEIILEARILAVADVVEAMASFRPYRPARGLDKALEEISQNRGVLYDPGVVDACLKLFTEKRVQFE